MASNTPDRYVHKGSTRQSVQPSTGNSRQTTETTGVHFRDVAQGMHPRRRFVRAVQLVKIHHSSPKIADDSDDEEEIELELLAKKTKKQTYLDASVCGRDDEEWSVFGGPTKKQQQVTVGRQRKSSLLWHKERSQMAARQQRTKVLAQPVHGLRVNAHVGPGDYDLNRVLSFPSAEFRQGLSPTEARALGRGKGARFSDAVVPSETEKLQKRAQALPSPGQYTLPDLAEEQRRRGGGKFNASKAKTALEWVEYKAKQTPGPGQYTLPDLAEEQRRHGGGRFNEATPKSHVEVLEKRAQAVPGPGAYQTGGGLNEVSPGAYLGRSERSTFLDAPLREASRLPGAADYDAAKSRDSLLPLRGVKFPSTTHEDSLRQLLLEASQRPGPGQYSKLREVELRGGKFNTANVPSHTEVLCQTAAQVPGPGQYESPVRPSKGTLFGSASEPLIALERSPGPCEYDPFGSNSEERLKGGKFNLARPLGPLDRQLLAAKQIPGPGQYNVTGTNRFGDSKSCFNLPPAHPKRR